MISAIPSSLGQPLESISDFLSNANDEIVLFAPYVNVEALKNLLSVRNAKLSIVTSWKLKDLWQGSSDINLYPFAKNNSFRIFINNSIHLKVFMVDWSQCVLGSSNISKRGLGIDNRFNYELNVILRSVDVNTLLYLRRILSESILMNDTVYQKYLEELEKLPEPIRIPESEILAPGLANQFTIASLPMSYNIEKLFEIYAQGFESDDKEAIDCAIHDVAVFQLPLDLNYNDFLAKLKKAFFNSSFIQILVEKLEKGPLYFGRTKTWVQNTCKDVPIPSKRDLTGNVQVLYRWLVDLGEGQYAVDRPHYSERLYKVK